MKKILSLLVVLAMLFACLNVWATPARDAREEDPEIPEAVVFFTNDVHCGIENGWGYSGVSGSKKLVEELGIPALLVDAGDHVQGGPIGTLSRGQYIIDIMNACQYDVAIPGNHEFDYGMDQFFNLVDSADYPYISANFMHYENGQPTDLVFDAYKVLEAGDWKIAFVGITTPEAITKSTPAYFQDEEGNYIYGFCQDSTGDMLVEQVQEAVDAANAEGADFVFVIGHCGIDEQSSPWMSTEIIPRLHGIDVFIDGHSHSVLNETVQNADGEDVILVQTGTKLENLGSIGIYGDGSLAAFVQNYQDEDVLIFPDPEVDELIGNINAEFEELLHEVVAYTPFDLTISDPVTGNRIVRKQETNLGDLCADAYRTLFDADIAFVNGGGVRANILTGEVTFEDIINVHPFGNEACLVEVTGQQILDALEMGSRVCPDENGGFLQCSGITYEIHTDMEPNVVIGEDKMWLGTAGVPYRVQNVQVMDRETGEYMPLDLERIYTLASHNYMLLDQGDGFAMFGRNNVNILQEDVMIDNAVLINYIQSMPGAEIDGVEYDHVVSEDYADPYGEGRIMIVTPERLWGDVDGDGDVDAADAITMMRFVMDLIPEEEICAGQCNVNGDEDYSFVDALLIMRKAMGLIDSFPVENN